MKLFYTPRSHFSRKVRIPCDAWGVPLEFVDVGNAASNESFGDNPLMKVPALVDEGVWIVDSDHIAQYIARTQRPKDDFGVNTTEPDLLNARAILNGLMAAEVEIILARRTGMDTSQFERFDKMFEAIRRSLDWLETHADVIPEVPSYAGFHLVCAWDHLALYDLVQLDHPKLAAHVARLSDLPYVAKSAPTA